MSDDPLDVFLSGLESENQKKPCAIPNSSESDASDGEVASILNPSTTDSQTSNDQDDSGSLPPLKKNIYVQARELASLSPEDVDAMRVRLGNIAVHGLNVPPPVEHWSQCGLPSAIASLIDHMRFRQPTPIQCQAIPCILSGRDVIGCAVTGSGKTLAFVLPAILHILAQPPLRPNETLCVFLSPTRELAMQTHSEASRFLRLFDMRSACLVGGSDVEHQLKALKSGAHVVVGTPGRFIDLMGNMKTFNLRRAGFFVIDEADRMFDLGFEPQVSRIAAQLRSDRQAMMFSATFPQVVERCARKLLSSPIEIVVGVRNVVSGDVEQRVEIVKPEAKLRRLFQLLGEFADKGQALVFTNTQEKAEELFGLLVQRGYKAALLHGGMDQADRASLIRDFRQKVYDLMVLTSVGSRGLDIVAIALVVNYDAPDHEADYVHRLGRTGRAGNKGWGYTFVEPMEKTSAIEIMSAMKKSNAPIPPELEEMCKGDVKRKWGFGGHGFRFDKMETQTFKKTRIEQADRKVSDDSESSEDVEQVIDDEVRQRSDGKFVAEFVINDFPAQARANVTKKQNLELIMDESGTTIIQRGVFVVPGSRAPVGERKLNLLVEGDTKYAVQVALQNLRTLANVNKSELAPVRKFRL